MNTPDLILAALRAGDKEKITAALTSAIQENNPTLPAEKTAKLAEDIAIQLCDAFVKFDQNTATLNTWLAIFQVNAPLEEMQRRVFDLRKVTLADGGRALHAAEVELSKLTSRPDWREPALISVRNIADHGITVDGHKVPASCTARVHPWQYRALSRFLQLIPDAEVVANPPGRNS